MITYSIIKKSELEGAYRLDAEYYQPEYLELTKKIEHRNHKILSEVSVSIKKGIFDLNPDNYRDGGIPFIRTSEINDPLIDFSSTVYLDHEVHARNKSTTLHSGDIVFTKIGANIGKVALLPAVFKEYNFSQNVAGVRVSKNLIFPGYLLAYLLSRFGILQI